MAKTINQAIDFEYLLVEKYKKLNLSEQELATILVMNHLLEQGNDLVTADLLALKMSLPIKEIDKILVTLVEKNFLEYETKGKNLRTTLRLLKDRLMREFELDILEERKLKTETDSSNQLKDIIGIFTKGLERDLTPLEKDKIAEWVKIGYSNDMIVSSFNEALSQNKKTIRSVDKILLKKAARNDIAKEGYTATNENYHKDINATIDMAKDKWNK